MFQQRVSTRKAPNLKPNGKMPGFSGAAWRPPSACVESVALVIYLRCCPLCPQLCATASRTLSQRRCYLSSLTDVQQLPKDRNGNIPWTLTRNSCHPHHPRDCTGQPSPADLVLRRKEEWEERCRLIFTARGERDKCGLVPAHVSYGKPWSQPVYICYIWFLRTTVHHGPKYFIYTW